MFNARRIAIVALAAAAPAFASSTADAGMLLPAVQKVREAASRMQADVTVYTGSVNGGVWKFTVTPDGTIDAYHRGEDVPAGSAVLDDENTAVEYELQNVLISGATGEDTRSKYEFKDVVISSATGETELKVTLTDLLVSSARTTS